MKFLKYITDLPNEAIFRIMKFSNTSGTYSIAYEYIWIKRNTVKIVSNVRRPQIKKRILWTLKIKKTAREAVSIDMLELNQSSEL